MRLHLSLPKSAEGQVIGKQLLRSATSVGAHYWEGIGRGSHAEFTSKLVGGLQELEESPYRLQLVGEAGIIQRQRLKELMDEAN